VSDELLVFKESRCTATCPVMKRNGGRGLELNLIKTRQDAKVDFSSTGRPFDRVLPPSGANPWLLNC
jgi:hypothetical protein